jgi:hypothetical protein
MYDLDRMSVVQVVPYDDYTVDVYFADGKVVRYDASNLKTHFKNSDEFKQSATVLNNTLTFDKEKQRDPDSISLIDVSPDVIYNCPSL